MAIVEVHDLLKVYKDPEFNLEVTALRGLNLTVEEGQLIGVIGPSGAGKTTLLSIIGGLLMPTSGIVEVDNHHVYELSNKELINFRRKTVGYLWQLPEDNLLGNISLLKNVMIPLQIAGKTRQEQLSRANDLLKRLGLNHRKNHKLHEVSGGEAQRAGLAVALANNPKILLGDQITGELDTTNSVEVINHLKELKDEFGTTMIIASHKTQFIDNTDYSYEIIDGQITKIITCIDEDLLTGDKKEFIFVDNLGNLRLPVEILEKIDIDNLMHAEIEDGYIKLIPIKNNQKKKRKKRMDNYEGKK